MSEKSYEQRWKEAEADIAVFKAWEEMKVSSHEALKKYNKLHTNKPLSQSEFEKLAMGYGYNRARYFMEHN